MRHLETARRATGSGASRVGHLHARLDRFVGVWQLTGRQLSGLAGPSKSITGTESYDWLEGGHFLVHRLHVSVGDEASGALDIIGLDRPSGAYASRTYSHAGAVTDWRWRELSPTGWRIEGCATLGGELLGVRSTVELSDDGNAIDTIWEHQAGDRAWQKYWELRSVRGQEFLKG